MRKRVSDFIRRYHMLETGSRVVAAVSGGADSVCLFHVLSQLRGEFQLKLLAVHVHHGLRGAEADRDAEFVENLAERFGVPCVVVHEDVAGYAEEHGLSAEEAGRILRYRALRYEAERFGAESPDDAGRCGDVRIAVGHQKEDQAETILHNLFRGSSLKGLSGMAPVSGDIIRPLLCVGRQEIRDYLKENGLDFREDSTNASSDYTRNRIRMMLPQICREVNAGAIDNILAAGEKMAQADRYFEELTEIIWAEKGSVEYEEENRNAVPAAGSGPENVPRRPGTADPGPEIAPRRPGMAVRCGLPADVLNRQPPILAGYLVMRMIRTMTGSVKDITSVHVEQIRGLAGKGTGRQISLPYGLKAVREYDMLWVERESQEEKKLPKLSFSRFSWKKSREIPQNKYTKWFDYDKIKSALSVRTRQTGDYITLKNGGRKTIKAFMIDEKIPRQERDRIPLLAEGNHVLWIVGYRISEYYKVTDHTKEVLQVQANGGKEHGGEGSGTAAGRRCE